VHARGHLKRRRRIRLDFRCGAGQYGLSDIRSEHFTSPLLVWRETSEFMGQGTAENSGRRKWVQVSLRKVQVLHLAARTTSISGRRSGAQRSEEPVGPMRSCRHPRMPISPPRLTRPAEPGSGALPPPVGPPAVVAAQPLTFVSQAKVFAVSEKTQPLIVPGEHES